MSSLYFRRKYSIFLVFFFTSAAIFGFFTPAEALFETTDRFLDHTMQVFFLHFKAILLGSDFFRSSVSSELFGNLFVVIRSNVTQNKDKHALKYPVNNTISIKVFH